MFPKGPNPNGAHLGQNSTTELKGIEKSREIVAPVAMNCNILLILSLVLSGM